MPMSRHFTYCSQASIKREPDLFQGDLILFDDRARTELQKHGVRLPEGLSIAIVTSQTCDLVESRLKAIPICIAPAFDAQSVIKSLIDEVAPRHESDGFRSKSSEVKVRELLGRVFNQNESARGLWFIHGDNALGIGQDAIASLRHPIAIPTSLYKTLKRCRVGRFTAEFRSQLGWMVGNLFSRPATTDFEASTLAKKVDPYIDKDEYIAPVHRPTLKQAKDAHGAGAEFDTVAQLRMIRSQKPKGTILNAVMDVLASEFDLDLSAQAKLRGKLSQSKNLTAAIEDASESSNP